ncbi:MAG TPA: MDR family MFS transporter [Candidatus Paceibacterota bacterium]|nr:MDR family MFS transporter [Candidatus Paceibacterota bacterium]
MLSTITNGQKIGVMAGVMVAMLLAALDQTIVSTAMPTIVKELNGLAELSWVFTAYMLTSTITVPIIGKLSDIYGRKLLYVISIVIFLLGSILSGFASSMFMLIVFRALQGIGGGALMSSAFTVIGDMFPPAERGKWQGLFGSVFGVASVIGPGLGGWITEAFSWRWAFFINIPVGIIALAIIYFLMPNFKSSIARRAIDYVGAFALAVGLTSLLLALVWGGSSYAWGSVQISGLLALAITALVAFGYTEYHAEDPILPLSLFKNSIFTLSNTIVFFIGMGMFGALTYIPLFAQNVLHIGAANSGVILMPLTFALIGASIFSGQVMSRTGKYKWLAFGGIAVTCIGIGSMFFMDPTTSQGSLIVRMIITGLGLGISMPIFTNIVQNAFDHSKLGVVTASTQLFRSLGATVGVAILGSILNNSLAQGNPLSGSITNLFLVSGGLMFAALIVAFFLKEIPLRKSHGAQNPLIEGAIDVALEEAQLEPRAEVRI